jgi:hypothetical protein
MILFTLGERREYLYFETGTGFIGVVNSSSLL